MKKLLVLGVVVVALVGAGLIAYAAYDITGSSSAENFTAGTAQNLVPDPNEGQLAGILPGQTKNVDVSVYNANPVGVTVTGVDLTVTPAGCAVTTTAWSGSYALGAGGTVGVVVPATMGNADPWCEGQTLQVSATAVGTIP